MMVVSKLFLYFLLAIAVILVVSYLSGCIDRRDMPQDTIGGIIVLDKEFRK